MEKEISQYGILYTLSNGVMQFSVWLEFNSDDSEAVYSICMCRELETIQLVGNRCSKIHCRSDRKTVTHGEGDFDPH